MPDSRNSVLDDIISPEQPVENGSQSATTSVGASGDQGIDGQLSGIRWASLAISYSFPDALSDYGYSVPGFSPLSITQRDTVQRVLEGTGTPAYAGFSVEGLTNLDISYRGYGAGTGTLRYANTGENTTAYAYYPSSSIYGGDSWYAGSGTNPAEGNYHYHTIMHETGHALGLKHGHETSLYGSLPAGTNSMEFSVMTYSSYVGSNNAAYYNESWGFSQTYMMYDIAALQYMYGANYSSNSGNTVYSWNPNNGTTYVDGATAISPGANRVFETIWDGGGTDTYDLSNYATDLRIDLAPGGYSLLSSAQRAYLGNGNYARGNVFNALLHDDDLRSIIENAIGGSGADSISGNIVQNLLDGGAGNDTLAGLEGADRLLGRDGADSLLGGAGNDMLDGGAGQDTLDGGTGSDTALYTDRTTSVRVDLSAGQASFPGTSAEVDTLVSIENAQGGADNDTFIGNGSDNSFSGNAGNDIFYGTGGGADIFDGGSGTDVMFFQASTAPVRVDLGQGVVSFPGQSLPNQTVISIENVQAGSGNDTLLGNASNNLLSGNAGNDSLSGGAGNDSLYGSAGNDTLDGGGGRDLLDGGEGIDTVLYTSSTTAVRIDLQAGTATVGGQSGTETLSLLENAQTGSGADTLLGTSGANELQGGGGADHLTGRGGADRLVGGAGNDVFHFLANDSTPAARDVIAAGGGATAFQGAGAAAGDRFDLSAYDADTTKAGIQDWLFGTAKTKGHLWMTTSGSQTILNGNNDNDAAIEFQVAIDDGNIAASAYKVQDFIL